MSPIDPDFEFINNQQVKHLPTGAIFTTYRYRDPRDAGGSVKVQTGRLDEDLAGGKCYHLDDVWPIAARLLNQRAIAEHAAGRY